MDKHSLPLQHLSFHEALSDKLSVKVLDCKLVSGLYMNENLKKHLEETVQEYSLGEKIIICTTDSASNIVKAVADMKIVHIPCCAHMLNLAENDVLEMDIFKNFAEVRHKLSQLCTHMKRSSNTKVEFEPCQRILAITPVKKLLLDVAAC